MEHQRLVQSSFFLNESAAISGFVSSLLANPWTPLGPSPGAVVICERKEDILAVRAQVAQGLAPSGRSLGGITVYTLDTLARNICSLLALGEGTHRAPFQKPFVDVVTQEKLVEMLLLQSHYSGSDRAPLAKQILALCDAPLPRDVNLIELLTEVSQGPSGGGPSGPAPTTGALKAVLGTYQKAQVLFSQYCRFQTLVEALSPGGPFDPLGPWHLAGEGLSFPRPLLTSHVLWVEAPQYRDPRWPPQGDPFCPGNFPHWAVGVFRSALAEAHYAEGGGTWWQQGFEVTALPERPPDPPLVLRVARTPASFFQSVQHHIDQGHLCLWADLSPTATPWMRPDAQGAYPLDPRAIEEFLGGGGRLMHPDPLEKVTGEPSELDPLPPGRHAKGDIETHLLAQWQHCQDLLAHLAPATAQLEAIDRAYGWPRLGYSQIFQRWCSGQTITLGNGYGHLAHLPMALSLLACPHTPPEVWALGPAHAPTPPSLVVRLLNGVFYSLRRQGVPLAPLAAEITYRGFWTSLPQARFLLTDGGQIEAFPRYMHTHRALVEVVGPRPRPVPMGLREEGWGLPHWAQQLSWRHRRGVLMVTVTELEAYIHCPLRFLTERVCGAQSPKAPAALGPGAKELGTRAHRMAEVFLADLKACHMLWPPGVLACLPTHMRRAAATLGTPPLALSETACEWSQALKRDLLGDLQGVDPLVAQVEAMAGRVCDLIFETSPANTPRHLHGDLERETLKRVFLRLILEEASKLEAAPEGGGFLLGAEVPVEFSCGPLIITGRIDRVEDLPGGIHHIIDYKTSTIPKDSKELALWPKGTVGSNQHLSLQTGLYTLAWALAGNRVGKTSLLRLKSLNTERDALLSHSFDPPLDQVAAKDHVPHFMPYVEALHRGEFAAKPFAPAVCMSCPMAHQCPQGA